MKIEMVIRARVGESHCNICDKEYFEIEIPVTFDTETGEVVIREDVAQNSLKQLTWTSLDVQVDVEGKSARLYHS